MHNWKTKKDRKKKNGSQTAGKTKGENCKATPLEKYLAKSSRSHKHPAYAEWCEKSKKLTYGSKNFN